LYRKELRRVGKGSNEGRTYFSGGGSDKKKKGEVFDSALNTRLPSTKEKGLKAIE